MGRKGTKGRIKLSKTEEKKIIKKANSKTTVIIKLLNGNIRDVMREKRKKEITEK